MRIAILAQHYAPEEVSGAVLATQLAEDLIKKGHEVVFITCAPNYPTGRVFPGYKNRIYSSEIMRGVRVIRTWSFITEKKSFWPRIINFGTFSFMALIGGLFTGDVDIILCYSPPLPLGLSAWLISVLRGIPWILRIEDLYPDAAIATGVIRNPNAIRLLKAVEIFIYRKAYHISLINESFQTNLLEKGIKQYKLSVIPVWADIEEIQTKQKENEYRTRYNLTDKFVILYSGNLGITSSLEDLIEAAKTLKKNHAIRFVIVGEGVKRNQLIEKVREDNLDNIIFLPYQPRMSFSTLLATADMSLVTLNADSARFSMPNKIFSIMASGRAILAICPDDHEIVKLINQYHCGLHTSPGNSKKLVDIIEYAVNNPGLVEEMGINGRLAAEAKFSRQICIDLFETLLQRTYDQNRINTA